MLHLCSYEAYFWILYRSFNGNKYCIESMSIVTVYVNICLFAQNCLYIYIMWLIKCVEFLLYYSMIAVRMSLQNWGPITVGTVFSVVQIRLYIVYCTVLYIRYIWSHMFPDSFGIIFLPLMRRFGIQIYYRKWN